MRALALATAVALVLGLVVLVRGEGMPWSPRCELAGPAGEAVLSGPPAEMAALVTRALAGQDGDAAVADALGSGPALSCRIAPIAATSVAKEDPLGLTPRAQAVRSEVRELFGDVPDGGFGPQEVLPGRRPGGEHSLGRAMDFFFRPTDDPAQAVAGWQLANWAVANAERLGIRTVIYRDRIWTARRSLQGWRDYRFAGADPDNPVNRHLDHVHIDVA
ncbi:MAG TPA: hypothetical protein VF143_01690 [Candidatus Nanopelagicales bacterium]